MERLKESEYSPRRRTSREFEEAMRSIRTMKMWCVFVYIAAAISVIGQIMLRLR
ncbi:MAG: hypothetical protein FWG65_04375 [Turicibacter sp.]|nr:hypothetical protein [Turicibacter sp.]